MIRWTDCDTALIGIASRCGQPDLPVYAYDQLVEHFIAEGMNTEDAVEWVDVNIAGAWVGPETPLIFYAMSPDETIALLTDGEESP